MPPTQGINTLLPSVRIDSSTPQIRQVLLDLQNGGLFRAIVLQREGNNVLLDTAFGKLSGQSRQTLQQGDEILARVVSTNDQPRLEVTQRSSPVLTLKHNALQQLVSQQGQQAPVAANVLRDNAGNTLLKINGQNIAIGKQPALQSAQTVLLRPTADKQIQILRVAPQPMLKAALSALLPRATKLPPQYNLSTLQKFSAELVDADRNALVSRANVKAAELPSRPPTTGTQANPNPPAPLNTRAPQPQLLTQLLANLARPLADAAKIQPTVLQQVFSTLALVKDPLQPQQPQPGNLTSNLLGLYRELKDSPESLRQMIRQVFQTQTVAGQPAAQADRPLIELGNTLRLELLQQTEQTLNQLLTQHTSTKLQLEQNLPLQWHLNIPLLVDQETRNLALKLRQKKARSTEHEEPGWEVELSFEFGLLGLITTRIQLNQKRISANFWSRLDSTRQLIDHNLDSFRAQLHRAGFEPEHFESYLGEAPQSEERAELAITENLLDLEA